MIEKKPFEILETKRLTLKPHEASFKYAQTLYDLIAKNKDHLSRYMPLLHKVNRVEDEYGFCVSCDQNWKKETAAEYGIWTKDRQLIGTCGIVHLDCDDCSGEIGYWLAQEHVGKGYMTEAVKALTDNFFARGFNRIEIIMDTQNTHSENVAIRCGFQKEGVMRQWHFNPYLNAFRDLCIYSKLKQDWENEKNNL